MAICEKAHFALWAARRENPALPLDPHRLAAAIVAVRGGAELAARAALDESSAAAVGLRRDDVPASLRIGSGRPSAMDRGGRLRTAAKNYMAALAEPPAPWQLAAMAALHWRAAYIADGILGGYAPEYAAAKWQELAAWAEAWDQARAAAEAPAAVEGEALAAAEAPAAVEGEALAAAEA